MKNLFYDLLNGLTPADFVLMAIQLFAALFIGHAVRIVCKASRKQFVPSVIMTTIVPVAVCFLVIVSKNSAPLSIALVGVFVLCGKLTFKNDFSESSIVLLLGIAGFACGSGFVMAALLVYLLIMLPILYFF